MSMSKTVAANAIEHYQFWETHISSYTHEVRQVELQNEFIGFDRVLNISEIKRYTYRYVTIAIN